MTNKAAIYFNTAYLWTEFGYDYAVRTFGQEVIDTLPKFARGAKKGKPKAMLNWSKVERGGWVTTGSGYDDGEGPMGYVERRVGKVLEINLTEADYYTSADMQRVIKRWTINGGVERECLPEPIFTPDWINEAINAETPYMAKLYINCVTHALAMNILSDEALS